jgi:TusA-related sulfurtransferase
MTPDGKTPTEDDDSPAPRNAPPHQQFARELDLRHVIRPLPVVVIARELSKMKHGELLRVVLNSEDGSASDMWALVKARPAFTLVSAETASEGHVHVVFQRSQG